MHLNFVGNRYLSMEVIGISAIHSISAIRQNEKMSLLYFATEQRVTLMDILIICFRGKFRVLLMRTIISSSIVFRVVLV